MFFILFGVTLFLAWAFLSEADGGGAKPFEQSGAFWFVVQKDGCRVRVVCSQTGVCVRVGPLGSLLI